MIVILGPNGGGKSTLAKKLSPNPWHFVKESGYKDYLTPLCSLELYDAVLDRCILCEYAYSQVMGRKFKFSLKQWHNVLLLMLIQKPVVILCTHKPIKEEYFKDQYLPYDLWDKCLDAYRLILNKHKIPYYEYDYEAWDGIGAIERLEKAFKCLVSWWIPMWKSGIGAAGSSEPKILLVAERLGPGNYNNIPFEAGPTGTMLSDMLYESNTPLGDFAVTNLVKAKRGDPRPPNSIDYDLLGVELENLRPNKVVFMGSVAKQAYSVVKEHKIESEHIIHLGYYHRQGITDMRGYHAEWAKICGLIPHPEFRKIP